MNYFTLIICITIAVLTSLFVWRPLMLPEFPLLYILTCAITGATLGWASVKIDSWLAK